MSRITIFLSVLVFVAEAAAGSLSAPFAMDSAAVLPAGIRSVRFSGFTTEIGEKYDAAGTIVPLGNNFNKQVTWRELTEEVPASERGNFRGGLKGLNIRMEDSAGDARGIVDARVTVNSPSLAYGVTEQITVGVGVPVVYSNTNVSTGWIANGSGWETLSRNGYAPKIKAFEEKLRNVVATKISKYGYKPLENEQKTELGDVVLGSKYQFLKSGSWAAAVAPKVVIPTGRVADVDKVVDIAPGDGQWDVGLSGIVDFHALPRLTLTSSLFYVHQLASNKTVRVPLTADEDLSPDKDSSVREKLGDMMGTGFSGRYRLAELWTVGAAYSYQYKLSDSYEGSQYSAERYQLLEQETNQNMHTAQAGLTFSTLPLFSAKKFAAPLEASISFASVLGGRNVNKTDLTTFELSAFF